MSTDASSRIRRIKQADSLPYKALGKQFVHEFKEDGITEAAAAVAYHLIFAIPPLLILIVTVAAVLNQFTRLPVAENLREMVNEQAPSSLQEVLNTIITNAVEQVGGGLASLGLVTTAAIAIWSGSNGIASIMRAYNRAYDVKEGRSYLKKRLVAVGLTLLMVVLINASVALLVFGESLGAWVAEWIGMGDVFRTAWGVLRWPVAIFLFMFLLAVLYYLAPNVQQSFRWISPGSVVSTILWVAALFGFRFYLQVADPGSTYGVFSSVLVFLFFLYITSIVLLIGAEVNAILQKRYDQEVVRHRAEHPEHLESEEARDEAAGEAKEFEQREGRAASPRAAAQVEERDRQRQRAAAPAGGDARGGWSLAAVGTLLGWLLGRRAGQRSADDAPSADQERPPIHHVDE